MGEFFIPPGELHYAAEQQFTADYEAAKTAYLEVISKKTGIVPIERPDTENTTFGK